MNGSPDPPGGHNSLTAPCQQQCKSLLALLVRRTYVPLECSEQHDLGLSPVPAKACHNSSEEPSDCRRARVPLECSEQYELGLSPVPARVCHNSEEPLIVESTQTSIFLFVASMRLLVDVCTATVISRHLCRLRSFTLQHLAIHRLDENFELAAQHGLGLPPLSYYHQVALVAALSIPSFSSRMFVHCHTGFDVHCESAVLLEGIVQHVLGLPPLRFYHQLVCALSVRVYSWFYDFGRRLPLGPISMLYVVVNSAGVSQLTQLEVMCTTEL